MKSSWKSILLIVLVFIIIIIGIIFRNKGEYIPNSSNDQISTVSTTTDQNINLLKTLSLLDEDLPGESIASKSKFSGALKEKVDEEFSMEGIRDIVSRKISDLKGPRT
jgi:hypothetical protein